LRKPKSPELLTLIAVSSPEPREEALNWRVAGRSSAPKPLGRWRQSPFLDHSKRSYSESGFRHLLDGCGFRVEAVRKFGGPFGFPVLGHGTLMMFRAVKL
jgi:hypothetical protein